MSLKEKAQTCLEIIYNSGFTFHGQSKYKYNFQFYVFWKFNHKRKKES